MRRINVVTLCCILLSLNLAFLTAFAIWLALR